MSRCPCGSERNYSHCCGPFIEQQLLPETPEQLMRSRYTAYNLANSTYIKSTMSGRALSNFNEAEAQKWAKSLCWLGLNVIDSSIEQSELGFVEFKVRFIDRNHLCVMHERSEFHKREQQWLYVDGIDKTVDDTKRKQKIARNSSCPCGSARKFKNCHEI